MQADLTSDFARYRFLVDFMEGNTKWEQANTIMAVYQGYTPEDDAQEEKGPRRLGVRRGWAQAFPGASPPDLSTADGLVEALESDFPEDPDLLDGLEVIVETVYGGEAKKVSGTTVFVGRGSSLRKSGYCKVGATLLVCLFVCLFACFSFPGCRLTGFLFFLSAWSDEP